MSDEVAVVLETSLVKGHKREHEHINHITGVEQSRTIRAVGYSFVIEEYLAYGLDIHSVYICLVDRWIDGIEKFAVYP